MSPTSDHVGSFEDAKERIRQSIDIVELVGRYLPLRSQGRNFVAICPWHNDSRPSLQVNPVRQTWKCWPCDVGGDIFSFVMKHDGVDFGQALRLLADMAGVPLGTSGRSRKGESDKDHMLRANAWAESQFHECLLRGPEGDAARGYLAGRGIDQESFKRYRIGFSPQNWQWLVDRSRSTDFGIDVLEKVGLLCRSQRSDNPFDRFRGRVMFPIRDPLGRTIAFGGRILPELATDDRTAKYVNSPESPVYSKSKQLYGLDAARDAIRKQGVAVVMEGYTDVVMVRQFGLNNGVAVLGTALTAAHVRLLRPYCDRIVLLLDGDEAGQRRANEVLELFVGQEVDLRIVTLPHGMDPCDFVREFGLPELEDRVASAPDALDHRIEVLTRDVDPVSDTHRIHQALESVLHLLGNAPQPAAATTAALREYQMLNRISRQFQTPHDQLRERLKSLRGRRKSRSAQDGETQQEGTKTVPLSSHDRELLELLTQYPEAMDVLRSEIELCDLDSSVARELYEVYLSFAEQGLVGNFPDVLAQVDDPVRKNLLVELDESAAQKWELVHEGAVEGALTMQLSTASQRLAALLEAYRQRRSKVRARDITRQLEVPQSDDEHMRLFASLIEQQKNRQGIAPTDG